MRESIVRDLRKRRFWAHASRNFFSCLGAFAVIIGAVDVFVDELLTNNFWVIALGLVIAAVYGALRSWPRPVETTYSAPNTKIRLVCGDFFDDSDAHLIVGATDTFDTAAPHISPTSIQGQFLERIYGSDLAELDQDIKHALSSLQGGEPVPGKLGNNIRYPLGTVATLRSHARRFFLVAYSRMDNRSSASSTTDGIWNSLSNLWTEVRSESNGSTVRIPIIGGGQSKLSPVLPAQDSIRFIALSFMLASRTSKVCNELVIVAQQVDYEKLDHLELQAYFDSLKPS